MKKILMILTLVFGVANGYAMSANDMVTSAENYLNFITGLVGEFTQTANDKKDKGTFSLLRPGRVRLDYKTLPIQLISNGRDLYFYDRSLDQITTVPLTSTPAGILVRKSINLKTADIEVTDATDLGNAFSLRMHVRGQEGIGNMQIVFAKNPTRLHSWVVTDAIGAKTEIVFDRMTMKTDFAKNYFELQRHKTTTRPGGESFYD